MICVFKCIFCGDKMVYDNESHKLICHTCNQTLDIEDYDYSYLSYDNSEIISDELSGCSCPSCGSKIIVGRIETNVTCAYCGSKMAAFGLSKDEISPEKIIPFKLNYDQAFGKILTWWESKKTMPKFEPEKLSFTLNELYVPVWLFNADVYTCMEAEVSPFDNTVEEVNANSEINRIRKAITSAYRRVPVDGSARINDSHFHGVEPFEYAELVDFNPGFLSGHNAERYFHSQYAIVPELIMKLQKFGVEQCKTYIAADRLGGPILESEVIDLEVIPEEVTYALVPMWIATYKYGGKSYQIFVNGQTGKTDGDVLFTGHKFEKEVAIRSLSSFFCYAMAMLPLAPVIQSLSIVGGRKNININNGFSLITIVIVLIDIFSLVKDVKNSSGKKMNLTIKVNEEMQYKHGRKFRFWPGTIIRFASGLLILLILFLNKTFEDLKGVGAANIAICILIAGLITFIDSFIFAKKRKRFIKRRQLVDYFEYIKAAGVQEEDAIVLR